MKAEYRKGCLQRNNVEREEYAGAQSAGIWEREERGGAKDLLEQILDRNNLNRAYKQVKRNHGAPGIDEMTVEEALPWLQEHKDEFCKVSGRAGISLARYGAKKFPNQMEAEYESLASLQ